MLLRVLGLVLPAGLALLAVGWAAPARAGGWEAGDVRVTFSDDVSTHQDPGSGYQDHLPTGAANGGTQVDSYSISGEYSGTTAERDARFGRDYLKHDATTGTRVYCTVYSNA